MKSNHAGSISGILQTEFILHNNRLKYHFTSFSGYGYSNNDFEGKWKSHETGNVQTCNWGDYRIPKAIGKLDVGDGQFCPDEKYQMNGWENFIKATGCRFILPQEEVEAARKIEQHPWWKD